MKKSVTQNWKAIVESVWKFGEFHLKSGKYVSQNDDTDIAHYNYISETLLPVYTAGTSI